MTAALASSPYGSLIMQSRYGFDSLPERVTMAHPVVLRRYEEACDLAVTESSDKAAERWPEIQYVEMIIRGRKFGALLSTPTIYGGRGIDAVLTPMLDTASDLAAWDETFGSREAIYLDSRRWSTLWSIQWEHYLIVGAPVHY